MSSWYCLIIGKICLLIRSTISPKKKKLYLVKFRKFRMFLQHFLRLKLPLTQQTGQQRKIQKHNVLHTEHTSTLLRRLTDFTRVVATVSALTLEIRLGFPAADFCCLFISSACFSFHLLSCSCIFSPPQISQPWKKCNRKTLVFSRFLFFSFCASSSFVSSLY